MESEKIVESVKFLLKSVRQLSDRFVEANDGISTTFDNVFSDVNELRIRLQELDEALVNLRDQQLIGGTAVRPAPELPVSEAHKDKAVPALNLPNEAVLDVYRNTPALLEPFSRPCSVSGKTLSGELDEVELEVFAQGTTWIIEMQTGDWVMVPRPGMLQRQTQLDGLSRLFNVIDEAALPAEFELLSFSTAPVIEHGRRWYLKAKGDIGVVSNPLEQSLEQRLRRIEDQLQSLTKSAGDS